MRNRLLLSTAALTGLVCVVLLVLAMVPPRQNSPGVTKENVDQLQIGMTRAQVDSILGPNHQHGGMHLLSDPPKEVLSPGRGGIVWLVFDNDDGTLIDVNWFDRVESFGEKFRVSQLASVTTFLTPREDDRVR